MSKRDRLTMDAMTPSNQPDEGYSEDPLNSTIHYDAMPTLAAPRSPSDLPAWISANASLLPMSLKKGDFSCPAKPVPGCPMGRVC